jgi:hypothetical protein
MSFLARQSHDAFAVDCLKEKNRHVYCFRMVKFHATNHQYVYIEIIVLI